MSNFVELYIILKLRISFFIIWPKLKNPYLATFWWFCDAGSHICALISPSDTRTLMVTTCASYPLQGSSLRTPLPVFNWTSMGCVITLLVHNWNYIALWILRSCFSLRHSDLDGNNVRIIPPSGEQFAHPFALTLFEDYVYWTDWNHKRVKRGDKLAGGSHMNYVTTLQIPMDVHIYHPLRQDQSKSLYHLFVIKGKVRWWVRGHFNNKMIYK